MEKQQFEELVIKAVEELPGEFQQKLENVDIIVEDWPSDQQLKKTGLKHRLQLMGLYEGVPQTKRAISYNLVLPDKITIFKRPIEDRCSSYREIQIAIREVVLHEIAHHFGISDQRLKELGDK